MPITIAPYTEADIPAVKEFNRRLRKGGAPLDYSFSESPISDWLPALPGAPVYNEFYLAREDGVVRGTYALKHQEFSFYGQIHPVVYLHHPLSEGIVNKKYASVGAQILKYIAREHPILFALGMGGYDRPLPKMLIALRWKHSAIPFYFRVNRPARFLREMQALRRSRKMRIAADVAAFTGTGWAGLKGIQALRGTKGRQLKADTDIVEQFDDWTNEIWQKCAPRFAMIGVRDAAVLRAVYPASNRNLIRLKITAAGRTVGWAVVADTKKQAHEQYGNLRVGTILDGLASPEDAPLVIAAATRVLTDRGVDLIASNQSHDAWVGGLKQCGYWKGPSNFIFAAAKKLSEMLDPFEQNLSRSHLTRFDGDSLLQYE